MERRRFIPAGQVQGVGFRPFVFRLARERSLSGTVVNGPEGVIIEAQGACADLDAFERDLLAEAPPLARIHSCRRESLPFVDGERGFVILPSRGGGETHEVLISPDMSTCEDCLAEMRDPANRRFAYAFTNCTNCGPRWTITRSIPYDRAGTTMSCFPLCPACRAEYEDPLDRRFHAQPNACPVCGPKLWTVPSGAPVHESVCPGDADGREDEALRAVALALHEGRIAAIKGLGGFHLACDAANAGAVALLRLRKRRPHKSLAVMVPSLEEARRIALLSPEEETLLVSAERPVVVCGRPRGLLAPEIAPDGTTLGIMLPYTPLHHVLLGHFAALRQTGVPPALVMTSGNAGGEPICLGNREALVRLGLVADIFLLHNRDILIRTDDSVVRPLAAPAGGDEAASPQLLIYRRARGFAPRPLRLGAPGPCVLGAGAELKAAVCLTRGEWAFMSQHIGDLQNAETLGFYNELLEHMRKLLRVRPEAVVCDLHPDYLSTRAAEGMGLPLHRLQHHFAHLWSVIAERGLEGPVLGLTLDGTGFGDDGTIWGGELLFVDTRCLEQRRVGRLAPFALPGGEAAVREPWRIAQGFLPDFGAGGEFWAGIGETRVDARSSAAVAEMLRRDTHCPRSSSCGRLFDAAAALLGLCPRISYEGQAPLRLESAQETRADEPAPLRTRGDMTGFAPRPEAGPGGSAPELELPLRERAGLWELDTHSLMRGLMEARLAHKGGAHTGALARAFHESAARGFAEMAHAAARRTGARRVALCGGVLQNARLARLLPDLLRRRGLEPFLPLEMPAHDGGIALGQAAFGRRLFK